MAVQKSQTDEFFIGLVSNVLSDLGAQYPELRLSFEKDLETIKSRVDSEGISFLTKTMPKLGKAIVRGLETLRFERPKEFKPYGRKAIPAFLSGILNRMFLDDGTVRTGFAPGLLRDAQQILFVVYKAELPYSRKQEQAVITSFVNNEQVLNGLVLDEHDPVLHSARQIIRHIFRDFNPREILPRHGPGSVATGEWGNEKWTFKRLFSDIHSFYPYYDYFFVGGQRSLLDNVAKYRSLERVPSGTAKVVLVPKDSRGPRLISCEPLEYQYIQQGLGRAIVRHLESHRFTRGQVNFTDQSINANEALVSSITRKYATLDMKDASDMVSTKLVNALFEGDLLKALHACRTRSTMLPDGSIVQMEKFAPMGSALCFPIEAIVFFSLSVALIHNEGASRLRHSLQNVFVYGDDILVPTEQATLVMDGLERYGLTVNRNKSFLKGFFRESCGTDAYRGVIVTPIRSKVGKIGKSQDASLAAQIVSLMNRFRSRGFDRTARFLEMRYARTFGRLPYGTARSAYLCIEVPSAFDALVQNLKQRARLRWNSDTQTTQIWARWLKPRSTVMEFDGWDRLLSSLVGGNSLDPSLVVRPRSTQISSGWRSCF